MMLYTMDSTLGELMGEPAVMALLEKLAPDVAHSNVLDMMKGAPLTVLAKQAAGKAALFSALLAAANGEQIDFASLAAAAKPLVSLHDPDPYDIDDVDGAMFMLDRSFGGCLILRFSEQMDESVYGTVRCGGELLQKGCLRTLSEAGGAQMLGVPVRGVFTAYDTAYTLLIEGFVSKRGVPMEPQTLTVRTLPQGRPDPRYAANEAVALRAAREGTVLLKNKDRLLPLAPDTAIDLIGAAAFRIGAAGAGKIHPRYAVRLERAIAEYSRFRVDANADTALLVVSRPSGENQDNRPIAGQFYLSEAELAAIRDCTKKHAHTIAILNVGYPIDVTWLDSLGVDAALWCGYGGMLGGAALVELLDGRACPCGCLPDTWSLRYEDIPASANFLCRDTKPDAFAATVYEEGLYVGYRYFETFHKAVAFPFGYGLSYTDFTVTSRYDGKQVHAAVRNSGTVAGKAVVQVYARIPEGRLEQPALRLVAFGKTRLLSPCEAEELLLPIEEGRLASFDPEQSAWVLEAGEYALLLGSSVRALAPCGSFTLESGKILRRSFPYLQPPVQIDELKKATPTFPKGAHSGVLPNGREGLHLTERRHFTEAPPPKYDLTEGLGLHDLARLCVCSGAGWGMAGRGEAGRVYPAEGLSLPDYVVADGNNGVNLRQRNIGMPCSNTVCASFDAELARQVGRVIAAEAKELGVQMILGPGMNLHRDPLCGRHPEYFSEDPLLTGVMAGSQSKGLEEGGVGSCLKHFVGNNAESLRKRNHSLIPERALRELYLKAFEIALEQQQPSAVMTGYNAVNGCYAAEDEELIEGILRGEFGFTGFVMTDWNSYETIDPIKAVQAGNCWLTPGTADDTYVTPLVDAVLRGDLDEARLRANARYLLKTVLGSEQK